MTQKIVSEKQGRYSRRDLFRDVGISLLYTLLIAGLVKLGIIQPIRSYSKGR